MLGLNHHRHDGTGNTGESSWRTATHVQ
jgi:hypothetical protein